MKIGKDTVEHLAELVKLEFNEAEKEAIVKDLGRIVGFVEKLQELPTDHVEPLIYLSRSHNRTRQDEVKQEITHEEALLNAPRKDSDYFRVPKVLDNKG